MLEVCRIIWHFNVFCCTGTCWRSVALSDTLMCSAAQAHAWSLSHYLTLCVLGQFLKFYMIIVQRFIMATIAQFSLSEQTHCALVVCGSEWATVALHSMFWTAVKVITALFSCRYGWCHEKLLPSLRTFCVHRITKHQFTVALYSIQQKGRLYECISRCWKSVALSDTLCCAAQAHAGGLSHCLTLCVVLPKHMLEVCRIVWHFVLCCPSTCWRSVALSDTLVELSEHKQMLEICDFFWHFVFWI